MKAYFRTLLLLLVLVLTSQTSWAVCVTSHLSTSDNESAKVPAGKINLPDLNFLPNGSIIKTIVVPPTNYTHAGAKASTVLWTCDYKDLNGMYYLVATNGDDRLGGYWTIGANEGLSDVYATALAYVGMKVRFSDVTVTRYWKKVPLTTYLQSGNKIMIRLQDLPTAVVELYRVSDIPPATGSASDWCGASKFIYPSAKGVTQNCNQPNFYIQLVGNGISHDQIGADSSNHYAFFLANNGFGYTMYQVARLYTVQTCAATSATPYVMFPPISEDELKNGKSVSQPFNVSLNCFAKVNSGTADAQIALGFQVSPGAFNAAQQLGLTNASGGVTTLLSDNYSSSDVAKGVGIDIAYAATPGLSMTLLGGQDALTPFDPRYTGAQAGWYPVLNNASKTGSQGVYFTYVTNFIATLRKINGQTVSAGKVHSTVTVQVRMQ